MGSRGHPLVWRHREGRPPLVIGRTSENIVGWPRADGVAFLDELLLRATTPHRICEHEWTAGDTVMWDNAGMLYAVGRTLTSGRREMIRSTLVGTEPTE
jgi:alpha-ketoglutarate-dependent sulfate ester dioxygenase